MDKAFLFHSEEELFLAKLQKNLLSKINENEVRIFPFFPVFAPCEDEKLNKMGEREFNSYLKERALSAFFLKPCTDAKGIFLPLELNLKNGDRILSPVRIAVFSDKKNPVDLKKILSDSDLPDAFPYNLKRLRTISYECTGFETKFYDEKWLKLSGKKKEECSGC